MGPRGLIMREDLSVFGMDASKQEGSQGLSNTPTFPTDGLAGRYQKIHANPVGYTLTDANGNNSWETNRRLQVGGGCTALDYNGVGPLYPNVWCRLQRQWSTNFSYFRSDDGQNWVWMGTTVWNDDTNAPPMPSTVYVGPEYSPETGNFSTNNAALRGRFLAKMRNYGNTWPTPLAATRTLSLGLKFGADYTTYPSSLAATAVAGVPGIAQANWNNLSGASGTANKLVADQSGTAVPTTVGVTWAANGTWATLGESGESNNILNGQDAVLMTGYLDSGDATTTTVTITNIPATVASSGYDVYVYACGSVATRGGGYRIVDAVTGSVLKDWVYATTPWFAPGYAPVPDNTSPTAYGSGNYILFKGLTSANITIQASTANGLGTTSARGMSSTPRAPINAVQLVNPTLAPPSSHPALGIARAGTTASITFTGNLYSAPSLKGPWTVVTGATSPYTVPAGAPTAFYRAGP